MDRFLHEQTNGRKAGWVFEQTASTVTRGVDNGWVNRCLEEWVCGWLAGYLGRWIGAHVCAHMCVCVCQV